MRKIQTQQIQFLPQFSIKYTHFDEKAHTLANTVISVKSKCMLGREAKSGGNSRGSLGYAVTISQSLIGMRGNMRFDSRGTALCYGHLI